MQQEIKEVEKLTAPHFSVEIANLKKPGSETLGGDKVFGNYNGSGALLDGMGGEGGDFRAARLGAYAINRQIEILGKDCSIKEAVAAIKAGFIAAGEAIRNGRRDGGEFATMDAVGEGVKVCRAPDGQRAFLVVGHVGDTRTHIYDPETRQLRRITIDQTLVQALVDGGVIKAEDAFNHPDRNIVSKGIADITPQTVDKVLRITIVELKPGQIVASSSDGLHDNLPENEIEKIFNESPEALDRAKKGGWQSGLAMHLAETAHGVMKKDEVDHAKPDDVSVLIIIPHFETIK